jgi:hypothetical protein
MLRAFPLLFLYQVAELSELNHNEIADLAASLDVKRGVRVRLRLALKEIRGVHLENLPTLDPVRDLIVFVVMYSLTFRLIEFFRKSESLSLNSKRSRTR